MENLKLAFLALSLVGNGALFYLYRHAAPAVAEGQSVAGGDAALVAMINHAVQLELTKSAAASPRAEADEKKFKDLQGRIDSLQAQLAARANGDVKSTAEHDAREAHLRAEAMKLKDEVLRACVRR